MRVLLVNPPFYRLWGSHYNGMMLGVASLTASLRAHGHDCWQFNADFEPHDDYLPTRTIHDNATGRSGWIPPTQQLCEESAAAIMAFDPQVVGYTCFSANYGMILKTSELVGRSRPDIMQIVGGPHATVDHNTAARSAYLSHRFSGEAEETLPGVLNGTLDWNERLGRILNLDTLPMAARDHWIGQDGRPLPAAQLRYVNTSYISTARGCPYVCAFCSAPRLWNRKVTYRNVQSVVDEFALLGERDNRQDIHVVDDTFTFHQRRAKKIMAGLVERRLTAPWKCESRADAIDEEIADAMAAAGCVRVKIGFESGSERILKLTRKLETKNQMRKAVRILQERGILVTGYWIAGYPGETDADLRQTIDFARELELDTYSLNIFAPYPGSELHAQTHGGWDHFIEDDPEKLFGQSRVEEINANLSETLLDEYWSLGSTTMARQN